MKEKINIHEIASQEGLRVVETTSAHNGYPENCQFALIGLENIEQAEALAKKYNLIIMRLFKHDGWGLWYRQGSTWEPITFDDSWISDNHRLLKKSALENFFQDEVAPDLEDVTDFEEAFAIMENAKTIYETLQDLDENEQLLLYEGKVEDTYPITAMELSYDTEMYAVALCE